MNLRLKIIQPTRTVLDTECDHVIIPGVDGDFGVSEEHTPFITRIRPGVLTVHYKSSEKENDSFAIHDGFVSIEKDTIRIACEIIERETEIDADRAKKARKRAEERMASQSEEINHRRAEYALKRAIARIQVLSG